MWGLPCPSADVTVRCCTAHLHPLSARNLETNVTDHVAYHSLFRFYAVHVYAFLLLFFCVPSVPSCFSSHLPVPSVTDRRDSLSRLSDTDGTGRLAIFTVPSCFRETATDDRSTRHTRPIIVSNYFYTVSSMHLWF